MRHSQSKLPELYNKADALFLQLSAYFKKMMHDHHKNQGLTIDQKKILKLFSYGAWDEYMKWIDQKLQDMEGQKPALPEIVEQEPDLEESYAEPAHPLPHSHSQSNHQILQCQLLAIQNAKIRKENLALTENIQHLKNQLQRVNYRLQPS